MKVSQLVMNKKMLSTACVQLLLSLQSVYFLFSFSWCLLAVTFVIPF